MGSTNALHPAGAAENVEHVARDAEGSIVLGSWDEFGAIGKIVFFSIGGPRRPPKVVARVHTGRRPLIKEIE